jgi:iron complex transport system substrate-binding protein
MVRIFRLCVLSVLSLGFAAHASAAPRRIVSMNLCADQLLIALADRGQIAALTHNARDPELSFYAREALDYPVSKGSAEEIMALGPDLIVSAPLRRRETLALLEKRHIKTVDVGFADSLGQIRTNIRTLAKAIGHPDRGEALIRRMDLDLERLKSLQAGRGRVAAYYQRRGYLTGAGTLVDEMMRRAGLINLAAKLRLPALSRVSLEQLIASRPDFLLLETGTREVTDRGSEMLHHPALQGVMPKARSLYIPQALTVCGGPSYPVAIATLTAQIRAADGLE